MRKTGCVIVLLALTAICVWAQQEVAPSTGEGPLSMKPLPPTPDKYGVYRMGPGIVAPTLVNPVPAVLPPNVAESRAPHMSMLSAVIGVDGTSRDIKRVGSAETAYDTPAIEAVKQSQFHSGSLNGGPVPVRVYVMVPFFYRKPATPQVMDHDPRIDGWQIREDGESVPEDNLVKIGPGVTPPRPINSVEAEFSDEARRKKIQGIVLISMIVDKNGLPANPQVVKAIGHGLDEKALDAVRLYRFQPAMRDGQPVAVRITVEVNFRLYRR